tara:strand:+ start:309 stop:485 length:177 start_codon:yes stop_codon:yes gene_type:complete
MTAIDEAKALLNNPEYVSAYAQWNRKPMETSDEDFTKAMDWAEALLFLSTQTNVQTQH